MVEVTEKENIDIENFIYEIRGKQVMLDSDLARFYQCKNGTKVINQAVNRNIERFPEDFYFQLTDDEYVILRSQFVTTKLNNMSRNLPYVFTEQGVAMLASILRTDIAAQMSVAIMRAFVNMRKYISSNLLEQKFINNQVIKNTEDIKILQKSFQKFEEKRKVNEIYFNGQIYDAYSKIKEIFKNSSRKLIIIDAYTDNTILDTIKSLKVSVLIITSKNNLLTVQDILKYNKQYHNLSVIYDNTFHDRYFLLDDKEVYHCGASINRIGYKTFSITLINDNLVCKMLRDRIDTIIKNNE